MLFLYNTDVKVHKLDNQLGDIHSKLPLDDMTRQIAGVFGVPVAAPGPGLGRCRQVRQQLRREPAVVLAGHHRALLSGADRRRHDAGDLPARRPHQFRSRRHSGALGRPRQSRRDARQGHLPDQQREARQFSTSSRSRLPSRRQLQPPDTAADAPASQTADAGSRRATPARQWREIVAMKPQWEAGDSIPVRHVVQPDHVGDADGIPKATSPASPRRRAPIATATRCWPGRSTTVDQAEGPRRSRAASSCLTSHDWHKAGGNDQEAGDRRRQSADRGPAVTRRQSYVKDLYEVAKQNGGLNVLGRLRAGGIRVCRTTMHGERRRSLADHQEGRPDRGLDRDLPGAAGSQDGRSSSRTPTELTL